MNMKKKAFGVKKLTALVFPLALALVLAACGGTGSPAIDNGGTSTITLGAAHGAGLAEWLSWLRDNAEDNTTYILPVPAGNSYLSGEQGWLPEGSGIIIDIRPAAPANLICSGEAGALFVVPSGVTLRLSQNTTLQGNRTALGFSVSDGGTLVMESGAKITGFLIPGIILGMFTMRGGAISGNSFGLIVREMGAFTMQGGIITQNDGTGVSVTGTFIMQGGIISRNNGFGVDISGLNPIDDVHEGGTFRISGGIIYGNSGTDANTDGALGMASPEHFTNPQPPLTARWGSGNIWYDIPVTANGRPTRLEAIDMRTGVLQP